MRDRGAVEISFANGMFADELQEVGVCSLFWSSDVTLEG